MFKLLVEADSQVIYKFPAMLDRDQEFERVCKLYPHMRIEMNENTDIIIRPPEALENAFRTSQAFFQLSVWTREEHDEIAFNGKVVWTLPNGTKRSPDASLVPKSILRQLSREELQSLSKVRLCPPFVIEVRSPSDHLKEQQERCWEWIRNGAQEVLLVDPQNPMVYRFLPSAEMETIVEPDHVKSVYLKNFTLKGQPFWRGMLDE